MKILIDTHVLIWLYENPQKLGSDALALVKDEDNTIYASYFSIFEIKIKSTAGKLSYDPRQLSEFDQMDINMLSPTLEQLNAYRIWDRKDRDPFDNALLGVAHAERYTFMTSDQAILSNNPPEIALLDARK